MAEIPLTSFQRCALLNIVSGNFKRIHGTTLKVLQQRGLIFFNCRKPIPTRRGLRFVATEAATRCSAKERA